MDFDFSLEQIIPITGDTITITGTGAIVVPIGTTAQRPSPVAGLVRYNSTLNALEFYNSTAVAWQTSGNTETNGLSTLATTGIVVRTGSGAYTTRTLQPTTNQISVTNGSGVAGDPTVSLPTTLIVPGSLQITTTLHETQSTTVSAAGATQGTATALTSRYNIVTTVAASTGVLLPTPATPFGREVYVTNRGANALNVYPNSGAAIGSGATNAAVVLPVGQEATFVAISATQWHVIEPILVAGTNVTLTPGPGTLTIAASGASGAPSTAQYVVLALDAGLSAERVLTGTANQTVFTDGGANGNITLTIADNVVLPGTGSMMVPDGTTAQRTAAADALFRYNTDEDIFEAAVGYPAGSDTSWAGLQKSLMYRKRVWKQDEFMGILPAVADTDSFGELGWVIRAAGTASNTMITAVADHPGIWSLETGTTSGNDTGIHMGSSATAGVVMANQVEYFAFLIRTTNITTMSLKVGLGQDVSSTTQGQNGTNGVWFEFFPATSANLRFNTRSGSTSSTPTEIVAMAANTWYLCEAFFDGTNWTPRVNGTNYTSISTNVPTTAVNIGAVVETLTTAQRDLQIDYFSMLSTELGNRY